MAEQVLSSYINRVGWKNDKASFNGAMKDLKAYRKEVEAINKAMGKVGVGSGGNGNTQTSNPNSPRTQRPPTRSRFEVRQASMIESITRKDMFNTEAISKENRERYQSMLKQVNTLDDLYRLERVIRNEVKQKNKLYRDNEKSLKRQNFLLQRMDTSSKQFAGNMVSAFAAVGAGTFILQTGGAFESVDSTMLAVSKDSKEAGENLAFVREEARRLGLSLVESSKGFAKLTAARGEVSLEDTRELFSGVSELSTLLGLTTVESGRALTAVQQMASKGKISAKNLAL